MILGIFFFLAYFHDGKSVDFVFQLVLLDSRGDVSEGQVVGKTRDGHLSSDIKENNKDPSSLYFGDYYDPQVPRA